MDKEKIQLTNRAGKIRLDQLLNLHSEIEYQYETRI
jgi:hypothetical protein